MENIFIGAWKDKRGISVDDVGFFFYYSANTFHFCTTDLLIDIIF